MECDFLFPIIIENLLLLVLNIDNFEKMQQLITGLHKDEVSGATGM